MSGSYTIVVPDNQQLSSLCGINDNNLRIIENFLGVPVFSRGNELVVYTSDTVIQRQFQNIIDRILDELQDGSDCSQELVNAILIIDNKNISYQNKPSRCFGDLSIQIPGGLRSIYPKTQNQGLLINCLRQHDMVFAEGPAGSGKTFLVIAEALKLVLSHEKRNLVLTRPVVEAGENLGFLPGDLEQKINPYLRPLYDAMEYLLPRELLRKLSESGIIEIAPLAYMRGRTLNNSVIILDEAQNTTCEQMKMFLTRMGENSKVFITGDITQVDLPKRVHSGLAHAIHVLQDIDDISIVRLEGCDVVRNNLVRKIILAYDRYKEESNE